MKNLELQYNLLTGSVPISIVDKLETYNEFAVNGNQLSNLTQIDGHVICTTADNSTGKFVEHYCNCQSECLYNIEIVIHLMSDLDYRTSCDCEEGRDCCKTYFVENDIDNCVLCEEGFTNPNFNVAELKFLSCSEAAVIFYDALGQYGTEEQCNDAKLRIFKQGCICPSYVPSI